MFRELETLTADLERKADSINGLREEFAEWLKHPVTVAMFADLKRGYLVSVDDESAQPKREVVAEILNTWGELPNDD